ncbi:MAG: hypothetical protein JSW11_19970 [Candidatus Heimdallarchaeota archaeon]|nr:MAG: hypothetical protein JSW11_19970 [Candidatus Heimdallarchaeota archaeon]
MWITLTIQQFSDVIRINLSSPVVLVWQIVDSTFMIFFLFIFVYTIRMKWDRPPLIILLIGVIWFSIIQTFILLYEVVNLPETGLVLFVKMRKYVDFHSPDVGVGLIT